MTLKLGGERAVVRIPAHGRDSVERGAIVGETAEHWLQQVGEAAFVVHFKSALAYRVQMHKVYEIGYIKRGQAVIREAQDLQLQPGEPKPKR